MIDVRDFLSDRNQLQTLILGFRSLEIDLEQMKSSVTHTHVFGDDIESDDIGDEAAKWISEFLGKDCRMSCRPRHRHLRQSEEASFHKNWRLGSISNQNLTFESVDSSKL